MHGNLKHLLPQHRGCKVNFTQRHNPRAVDEFAFTNQLYLVNNARAPANEEEMVR